MGIYTGAMNLGAQKAKAFRTLNAAVEDQKRAFAKAQGKRKMWDLGGDIIKTLVPGYGHVADLGIDYLSAKNIKGGDPAALSGLKSGWTKSESKEASRELEGMVKEAEPDFLSMALEQGIDYLGSKAGGKFLDKTKGLLKGAPTPEIGAELSEAASSFDPLEFMASESRSPRLERETIEGLDYSPMYKMGGIVSGSGEPTIAEYFGAQGKTLGGSNKQSIAEMLGRK